jgi:hypothetical protein
MVVTRATGHALCSMIGQGVRGCGPQTLTWHISQTPTIPTSGALMTQPHPPTGVRTTIDIVQRRIADLVRKVLAKVDAPSCQPPLSIG